MRFPSFCLYAGPVSLAAMTSTSCPLAAIPCARNCTIREAPLIIGGYGWVKYAIFIVTSSEQLPLNALFLFFFLWASSALPP